jgi:hypothetical protein
MLLMGAQALAAAAPACPADHSSMVKLACEATSQHIEEQALSKHQGYCSNLQGCM